MKITEEYFYQTMKNMGFKQTKHPELPNYQVWTHTASGRYIETASKDWRDAYHKMTAGDKPYDAVEVIRKLFIEFAKKIKRAR